MISIYVLEDPSTSQIRYVGQTRSIVKRMYGHAQSPTGCIKDLWAKDLKSKGIKPVIHVIEMVPQDQADDAEMFWIEYFTAIGASLLNATRRYSRDYNFLVREYKEAVYYKYMNLMLDSKSKEDAVTARNVLTEVNTLPRSVLTRFALSNKYL